LCALAPRARWGSRPQARKREDYHSDNRPNMRILIGCEFRGVMREAFSDLGHDAWSCDLLPDMSLIPGAKHLQCDVLTILNRGWDLGIFHPDCTRLTVAGARWFKDHYSEMAEALNFVRSLWAAPIPRVAIENPVGVLSTLWQKPTQIVQPWWFGVPETKNFCLWLRNLPKLTPTDVVPKSSRYPRVHHEPPGTDRWARRSTIDPRMASAIASQWNHLTPSAPTCPSGNPLGK
jgi:hypothetical protein